MSGSNVLDPCSCFVIRLAELLFWVMRCNGICIGIYCHPDHVFGILSVLADFPLSALLTTYKDTKLRTTAYLIVITMMNESDEVIEPFINTFCSRHSAL